MLFLFFTIIPEQYDTTVFYVVSENKFAKILILSNY
jgi:hypothetical protein